MVEKTIELDDKKIVFVSLKEAENTLTFCLRFNDKIEGNSVYLHESLEVKNILGNVKKEDHNIYSQGKSTPSEAYTNIFIAGLRNAEEALAYISELKRQEYLNNADEQKISSAFKELEKSEGLSR